MQKHFVQRDSVDKVLQQLFPIPCRYCVAQTDFVTPTGQMIDFLDWDVVIFRHPCAPQNCVENHAAGSAVPVTNRMHPVQDPISNGGIHNCVTKSSLS